MKVDPGGRGENTRAGSVKHESGDCYTDAKLRSSFSSVVNFMVAIGLFAIVYVLEYARTVFIPKRSDRAEVGMMN